MGHRCHLHVGFLFDLEGKKRKGRRNQRGCVIENLSLDLCKCTENNRLFMLALGVGGEQARIKIYSVWEIKDPWYIVQIPRD